MKSLFVFASLLLFVGCGTVQTRKSEPKKAEQATLQRFENIRQQVGKTSDTDVARLLMNFIKDTPESDITDDAQMLLGDLYYRHKRYSDALKAYTPIVSSQSYSPLYDKARIKSAYCLAFMNEDRKAYDLINAVINESKLSEADATNALKLKAELGRRFGSAIDQVETYYNLAKSADNPSLKKKF
ncbi:MAG: tetratricopeptide repeat protein, partial [Bdellovibrionales bacterium]|nr:tetratricopeptide repeat protein [Bdellovibrionales bacterium]